MTNTVANMEEIPEIRLHIGDYSFTAKKNLLCEYSDYFQAMFSGNYVENDQRDITINVDAVDENSMNIILRYFEMGQIDLSEHELPVIGSLAAAANFLQITELAKQIEYCLDIQLTHSNWVQTMTIAQNAVYKKLEQASAAYGVLNFKTMMVECIPSIEKLFWYLSHPYLDTDNEMDVFKFGLQWVVSNETGADALLIILGCLDMKGLDAKYLKEIRDQIMKQYPGNSLAVKVVECLLVVRESKILSESNVMFQKDSLCELFTDKVYVEVLNLVKESRERNLLYTSAIAIWICRVGKAYYGPHYLYTFSKEKGFEQWLKIGDEHLWGFSVASWGATKIVVVGGESGRGSGFFMRDVKVYDTLKKEWICHGVELPKRRHGSVAILGDNMFFIGGVGEFRVVLDTGISYDMRLRSFRKIANLPENVQNPGICAHKGKIYASINPDHIDKYNDETENYGSWTEAVKTAVRYDKMISFKDHVYCTQNYFGFIFRFEPGVDDKIQHITTFSHPAAALCSLKNRLLVITKSMSMEAVLIAIEELKEGNIDSFKTICQEYEIPFNINDAAGTCTFVSDIPPIHDFVSSYHLKYLSQYKYSI